MSSGIKTPELGKLGRVVHGSSSSIIVGIRDTLVCIAT